MTSFPKVAAVKNAELPPLPQSVVSDGYPHLPARVLFLGPSGGYKTTLITHLCTKGYLDTNGKSLFSRIFVFSRTAKLDLKFKHITKWSNKNKNIDESEQLLFDDWDEKTVTGVFHEIQTTA